MLLSYFITTTSLSSSSPSRRNFLKIGAGVVGGAVVASAVAVPLYLNQGASDTSTMSSLQSQLAGAQSSLAAANQHVTTLQGQVNTASQQVSSLQSQNSALQAQSDTVTGFLYLSNAEQSLLEAVAETIIPSDSNGPGATEAGVIYFIDRQMASDYGASGTMYMEGPFVQQGLSGPITVGGITYPNGTPTHRVNAGTHYQYAMNMRFFFHYGLQALQNYAVGAYGGNFETLTAAQQTEVLQDLWNNKPAQANFNNIVPADFAFELFFLVWSGFLMDPLYGGNRNMVGWSYVGFNGANFGNFYNEGHTAIQLMVATTPTRLQPASLSQLQKGSP